MLIVKLNPNEEENILKGFPWVYNNEVHSFEGNIQNGEVVEVNSFQNQFVGYGFLNVNSKLMVRILTLCKEDKINKDFFRRKIQYALEHRKNMKLGNAQRLIFAEADFLPGLIVDQYNDILSVQFLCLGMDKIKQDIIHILIEELNPRGIYERSDTLVRLKEGLEETKGILYGEFNPRVEVIENGIRFIVDVEHGQKTGYFLDQKLNRDMVKYYVKDKVVLDCFSNVGGFALHACKYGAKYVDACDISKLACEEIEANAKRNNFKQLNVICTDVFDYLRKEELKDKYDVIILDPPAFTKDKTTVKKAYRGYKEINLQALKIIKSGGYLLTFSCSQHMTPELFMEMLKDASVDAKREVQFLDFRIQSPDHPALLTGKEQLYLKCVVLRVK
ncbi:MAG: class I SAM-dependent rRNA methyltransferase [Roseburia sp.]|nr:class I SAM-dependent rRNA methyltransferase [Anaeroplasma bactoclasticum]MCM1196201.1 class I SAM-dependent rRNA methyltransferase [Roseburia sp.]MCM1557281.1 class I SAM-dependent rRNA methyltransferase [Anaeroplasma bactoclasticum]